MPAFDIRVDDLTAEASRALLALHLGGMHASSPPGHVFALDLAGLTAPEVTVWSVWSGKELAGIGALKELGNGIGELKSMRTDPRHLRQGVAAALLEHIIGEAQRRGLKRLSIETGRGPAFEAALALYRKRGFIDGEIFADYVRSDFNQFLHLALADPAPGDALALPGAVTQAHSMRQYRYYDFFMAAYVCILLCANLIGPAKVSTVHLPLIGDITFLAGVLFFPLSYIFGDVLTEVYGYARDRRVVWAGFCALGFASLMASVIVALPPSPDWRSKQPAVEAIFGNTPRIVAASIIAFWCGSFVNSFVMAKMKLWTEGRWLWTRTVGSTLCGELVDSALFYSIAFYGLWDARLLETVMLTQYLLKSGWEIVMTPVTYRIVGFLKRSEQEDFYDRDTRFTPFSLKG